LVTYYDSAPSSGLPRRRTGIFQAVEPPEGADTETREGASVTFHRQTLNFTTSAFQAGGNPAGPGATAPQLVELYYRHRYLRADPADAARNDLRLGHPWERFLLKAIHWVDWPTFGKDGYSLKEGYSYMDRPYPGAPTGALGASEGAGFSVLFFALRFYNGSANPPAWTANGNWGTGRPGAPGVDANGNMYLPAAVEITLVIRPQTAVREFPFVRVVEIPAARR
jgi:hypothetical protein